MAKVKGLYTFKDILTHCPSEIELVNFTSGTDNDAFIGFCFTANIAPVLMLGYILEFNEDGDPYPQDAYYYEENPNYDIEIGICDEEHPMIYMCTDAERNGAYYKVGNISIR